MRELRTTSRTVAFGELFEAFEACPGDDPGHDVRPVSAMTFATARAFLAALPTAFPSPEVAATDSGEVAMDWFPGPRSTFTVMVSGERRLIFATATPDRRLRGVEAFAGEVPDAILSELRRLF